MNPNPTKITKNCCVMGKHVRWDWGTKEGVELERVGNWGGWGTEEVEKWRGDWRGWGPGEGGVTRDWGGWSKYSLFIISWSYETELIIQTWS